MLSEFLLLRPSSSPFCIKSTQLSEFLLAIASHCDKDFRVGGRRFISRVGIIKGYLKAKEYIHIMIYVCMYVNVCKYVCK